MSSTSADKRFPEYRQMDFPAMEREILDFWKKNDIFQKSVEQRNASKSFTFYEGPPSANGAPGIHHVMARAIKDVFCRYKTLTGHRVMRKAGWDTHGLPIEIQVEKTLGITKEDIGKKISVAEYNAACRRDVLKYKEAFDLLTEKIGFWVDLDNPYITYENEYIESVWNLLKQLHDKGFLYKGYTIQPYSPAAGTGLSSHELNQPGTYKMVKDTTIVAQFIWDKEKSDAAGNALAEIAGKSDAPVYFLAWTTTPWTLPSNTALAVGEKIDYAVVRSFNPYTHQPITVVLATDLVGKYFSAESADKDLNEYRLGDKQIPWKLLGTLRGKDLTGNRYSPIFNYAKPTEGDAWRVVAGDFVSTEDGTGIVHLAPSFGADDFRTARANGIGALTLVDRQGRFTTEVVDFAGRYVKEEYEDPTTKPADYKSTDVLIAIKLKEENKAFRVEKYEHTYPHCWRTDKPILYYPLESWFIKTTAVKDRMVELNKTINWKPESTGTGRFGNWLENLVDWNLSRSRYWGTPLPIWRTDDGSEEICIGSLEELKIEMQKAVDAGIMSSIPPIDDLHRPYVDDIYLVSPSGKKMTREADLIDVWFDSGAMPYAQWHYPFENRDEFNKAFPADFIAEGVDQTRGWFFTLHAISVMLYDSIAYKNVLANGLVLDKAGNKMSKRLGNVIDPFATVDKYGADALRWYMLYNAPPWDNLKFDLEGMAEVQRRLFATLYNVYSFFSLYANIDDFHGQYDEQPYGSRPEIDRWIVSLVQALIQEVEEAMEDYDPTRATRAITDFVIDDLSNWYVRLCRRRFWKGEMTDDKLSAYQTLHYALVNVGILMSSFAPFYSDRIFGDLTRNFKGTWAESVHLADFPLADATLRNEQLEEQMRLAQQISSMALALRKKVNIKVRQPLRKLLIPADNDRVVRHLSRVKDLVMAEINVKEIAFLTGSEFTLIKRAKPNFKVLGKKIGGAMKELAQAMQEMKNEEISLFETEGSYTFKLSSGPITIFTEEAEIVAEDIPGWQVMSDGQLTVALDTEVDQDLMDEGIAREFINRVQNLRKSTGLQVTDKIRVLFTAEESTKTALSRYQDYICGEILAVEISQVENLPNGENVEVNESPVVIEINKA